MPYPRRRVARRIHRHVPRSGREAAFVVLSQYKQHGRFVAQLLDELLATADFSDVERRFAAELANGVIRRRATLDALVLRHVRRPRHRIEGELWTLLQIGAYQLVFLDSVPGYAAVNEMVDLAKTGGRRGWDGFVNGVLRGVQRTVGDELVDRAGANAVPTVDGFFRRLTIDVFPDPSADAAGYIADAFSFPRWLVDRWRLTRDFDELCRLGFWFNKPGSLTLRVNETKTSRDEVRPMLEAQGIKTAPGDLHESIRLDGTLRVDRLPGFAEGLFCVQDESAMSAVDLLAPRPGETVLDLCAAPGAKTTHIAERMRNVGTVIAADVRADRLARIDENCRRLGLTIVRSQLVSPDGQDVPGGPFDAVLADVPCSNTGVLSKRPEARWRIDAAQIAELSIRQRALLEAACRRTKAGGRVVYSTCSIEPEENEQIVQSVLQSAADMELVCQRQYVPGRPGDGGFQALLRKGRRLAD